MKRWPRFAGLAKEYKRQGLEVILANPFSFRASTYEKIRVLAEEVGLEEGASNFHLLHHAKHPRVDRHSPEISPGWNSTNDEIKALKRSGAYALFNRKGQLVFLGRASFEEIRAKVKALIRKP